MKSFKMFRIVCTITETALLYGSELPHSHVTWRDGGPQWYNRGHWSASKGTFWSGEETVRKHLHRLCCDWERRFDPARRATNQYYTGHLVRVAGPDWSRLAHLRVEQFLVTSHTMTVLSASDFMGIAIESAA